MTIDRIALGTRKGLLLLEKTKDQWRVVQEAFSGSHVSIVFLDRHSGNLYACLDDGHFGNKLFQWEGFTDDQQWKTKPAKESWREITCPAYPEGSKLPDGKDAVLKYQWAMASSSGDQPKTSRLFLGTEPGGLFISDDCGQSFQLCESLWNHPSRTLESMPWFGGGRDQAGIHSICVDPRNPDHIRVGISCAGVFLSEDAGASWRPTNTGLRADFLPDPNAETGHDPHLLVQCQSQPDMLWQQNHCGVFKSTNGGETWVDVSESEGAVGFGFPIAVDPSDGNIAWVIPAESDQVRAAVDRNLSVCRTENGGQTWTRFSNGLPQGDCFDFAFRHGFIHDLDDLMFGTACGSLYASVDRAESWKSINAHFPPIYCVEKI